MLFRSPAVVPNLTPDNRNLIVEFFKIAHNLQEGFFGTQAEQRKAETLALMPEPLFSFLLSALAFLGHVNLLQNYRRLD